MDASGYNGQPRYRDNGSTAGRPGKIVELTEASDAGDATDELANEVTTELPDHESRAIDAPLRVANDDTDEDAVAAEPMAPGDSAIGTTGTVLSDRYVLERPLGNGGTALVSRARDLRSEDGSAEPPHVAIKMLRPELRHRPKSIARLMREFRQTQSLTHPNVVRFYDLDCDRGTWFIAMELLTGEALCQRLRRVSPESMPPQEALRIAAACGEALAFAHAHGVTHGDVKPGNIFITETDEVRLFDFGVAPESVPQASLADDGQADLVAPAATRAYASPEVLSGQRPEPRDDVFSLACVIYEMLAGRHPYGRRGADEACDARVEIRPITGLSMRQWQALAAGLAWNREQRPAHILDLLDGLGVNSSALQTGPQAVSLPVPTVPRKPHEPLNMAWRRAAAIASAFVVGLLIGRMGFEPESGPESQSRGMPEAAAGTDGGDASGGIAAATRAAAVTDPGTPGAAAAGSAAFASRARSATPPGRIGFDAASLVVSRNAVAAAIPVRRLGPAGRSARFTWQARDGTAVAGRDYGGPQSGVASFIEGHAFRMIYVPIVSNMPEPGDKSFTVELTGAAGASLGSKRHIVVTIRDDG
jgi:serine/threonine protein kinase